MRFFSNDAKETHDDDTDRPDDSPSVPQQRIGSPWSDTRTDDNDTTEVTDKSEVSDSSDNSDLAKDAATDEHVDPELLDGEPADRTEDETVDGEIVDPEPTGRHAEHTDADTGDVDAVDAERVDAEDEPIDAETVDAEPVAEGGHNDHDLGGPESSADEPDELDLPLDEEPRDTVAEEHETELDTPVGVTPVDSDSDSTTYASAAADEDTPEDAPAAVDSPVAEDAVVVAAVPVAAAETVPATTETGAAKPGSVEEKTLDTFFGADAAAAFQERWRDVQLRFVDSPKEATAEAASLVDEAVDALTANLKAQKDGLLSDSDDTEKLRVELRGYREVLNKVLSL